MDAATACAGSRSKPSMHFSVGNLEPHASPLICTGFCRLLVSPASPVPPRVYPALQPESPLYNQNPHFTTHKPFQNPHFATGCERLLTSVLSDNVKASNLQHHPLQHSCSLESLAGCNVGVLNPNPRHMCACIYIYIHILHIYIYTHIYMLYLSYIMNIIDIIDILDIIDIIDIIDITIYIYMYICIYVYMYICIYVLYILYIIYYILYVIYYILYIIYYILYIIYYILNIINYILYIIYYKL